MIDLNNRIHSLFTSTISGDIKGEPTIIGHNLTNLASTKSFSYIAGSLWLGHPLKSKKTEQALDLAFRLLVDHGPYVSGAVNTMITARAGKDLIDSLAAGLLTIGPRFGGAVNTSAKIWFEAIQSAVSASQTVEDFAIRKEYIAGIGHRKYRIDLPDPRVPMLIKLAPKKHLYLDFALAVSKITTAKKPNLILNVDGALAALMLDILSQEEKLTKEELSTLIDAGFFNAIFVLSRTVGLIAHYLDQKRLGEPLFRLPDNQVLTK